MAPRRLLSTLMLAAIVMSADGAIATAQRGAGEVTIRVDPGLPQSDQLTTTARAAVTLFAEWLGAYQAASLEVLPASRNGADTVTPGVIAVPVRVWILPRDVSVERSLIASLAKQYWIVAGGRAADADFQEGLGLYIATRGIHELLSGRNLLTVHAAGGFLTYAVRAIQLSPNLPQPSPRVRQFDEVAGGVAADRVALVLHTLERYIGWPALQPALAALRLDTSRLLGPHTLAAILQEQRGVDLGWFFDDVVSPQARIDYAVTQLSSARVESGEYRTTVSLRRGGADFTSAPALPVQTTFADGSTISDDWDGGANEVQLTYSSKSPAVSAVVDPSLVQLLDSDRANNNRRLEPAPIDPVGTRLGSHWLIWLQDLMLTCLSVT